VALGHAIEADSSGDYLLSPSRRYRLLLPKGYSVIFDIRHVEGFAVHDYDIFLRKDDGKEFGGTRIAVFSQPLASEVTESRG